MLQGMILEKGFMKYWKYGKRMDVIVQLHCMYSIEI